MSTMVTAGPPAPPGTPPHPPAPRLIPLPGDPDDPPTSSSDQPGGNPDTTSPGTTPSTRSTPAPFARLTAGGNFRVPDAESRGGTGGDGGDGDWHHPDPHAGRDLGAGRNPFDRALARNKSEHGRSRTATGARMALRILNDDDTAVDPDALRAYAWHQISVESAQDFHRAIYRRYDNQTSRNDRICSLRAIVQECYKAGLITALRREQLLEELYTVAPGRSSRRHRITVEEFDALMDACLNTGTPVMRARNSAIVALFYTTGLRVGELVRIDLAHWNHRDDSIRLPHTKNTDPHTLFLHPGTKELLMRWLQVRGPEPGKLFTGQHRPPDASLHPATVRDMLASRCRAAGIEYFGTHDFRRTFATTMLRQYDAALVSKLLNHRKLASTLIYDMTTDDEMRNAVGTINLTSRRIGGAA